MILLSCVGVKHILCVVTRADSGRLMFLTPSICGDASRMIRYDAGGVHTPPFFTPLAVCSVYHAARVLRFSRSFLVLLVDTREHEFYVRT